jgi:predicted Zn-ribbon and HTH transcriptional regulator
MKYIKKFNESDAWAGSLYAYQRGINDKPSTMDVDIPKLIMYPFKCNDCGIEFESLNFNEDECRGCGSKNIEEITITYED